MRTIVAGDPAVRANLLSALAGPDAPAGVRSCFERDDIVSISFDDDVAAIDVIDDLITIESHFVPPAAPDPADDATRLTSVGLDDPAGEVPALLERQLAGLD